MPEDKNQEIITGEDSGSSEEKIKKVKEKLKQCQKEKQEYLTGWQREKADFINYKRRQEEQMAEWSKMLGEGLVRDILPVLDTLEPRNYADLDAEQRGKGEVVKGLELLRQQLLKILQNHGLSEIKAVGEKFDPQLHEAVEQVAGEESGMVVEEVQRGYLLNGKVLRVAKVKVNK
jgi:molecular chaperone GrpE